jgi:hypothetical protein
MGLSVQYQVFGSRQIGQGNRRPAAAAAATSTASAAFGEGDRNRLIPIHDDGGIAGGTSQVAASGCKPATIRCCWSSRPLGVPSGESTRPVYKIYYIAAVYIRRGRYSDYLSTRVL